jgi:hypothetical protein
VDTVNTLQELAKVMWDAPTRMLTGQTWEIVDDGHICTREHYSDGSILVADGFLDGGIRWTDSPATKKPDITCPYCYQINPAPGYGGCQMCGAPLGETK